MGRKRTGTGQFIYFCVTSLILVPLWSCTTFKKEVISHQEMRIEEIPRQKEEETQEPSEKIHEEKIAEKIKDEEVLKGFGELLQRARKLMDQGDYEAALEENQRVLSLSEENSLADQALFNMGLIYAHSGNPKKNYGSSRLFFLRLIKDFPQSPLVEEAKSWAAVLKDNETLRQVIEKSKQVDIAVEEKKRKKER